ncbi:MAG TPA: hypothetical protein VKV73_07040 [Chloroflexota bacterium]|nr:hypothetical protein [Chloroflexota bacterium]
MLAQDTATQPVIGGKELLRHIDRAVSRALVDSDYARLLLSDPTVVLEDHACRPQDYLSILSIQADTLLDFARQAQALFWAIKPDTQELVEEDALPLAAAAS